VPITLLVRGICCLRPGIAGVSDTIEVRALIDRFLEHGRAFHFANGGHDEVYIASADWMPRNFHRRVEAMVPIEDPVIRARLIEILQIQCADNAKSWLLKPDGKYERVHLATAQPPLRSQTRFIEMTRDRVKAAESAATSGRFHLSSLPNGRTKIDGGKGEGHRARRENRLGKKIS
jgi:polyphosphate kinase